MSESGRFWREGQRALDNLIRLCQDLPGALRAQEHADRALVVLTGVGTLRRLLDQVEFEAIRASRRQGKSWAEIAVRLGVTRQSAWERWRDIDEPDESRPAEDESRRDIDEAIEVGAGVEVEPRAARRRRLSTVVVPNVTGMTCENALDELSSSGLLGVGPDPDGPSLEVMRGLELVVTDQSPESGATVPPHSAVTLWIERGDGGSGVREPRRPVPDPKIGRKMLDEPTDEAVR